MSQIESIKVGGENGVVYNLNADALTTPRAINGVEFDGESDISNFATCSTAASTAEKTVSITGFSLSAGAMVRVKFTAGNTATAPTMNVNSTGAKAIVEYGSTAAGSAAWAAGEVVDFCYDGTSWCMVSGATGTDTVRGKVIVDAEPTSGSTNAVQSGSTADMINSMTEAAYITQSATGEHYQRATMTSATETGFEIKVNDAADNIPLKSLAVSCMRGTAQQMSVTSEAADTVVYNQRLFAAVSTGSAAGEWWLGNYTGPSGAKISTLTVSDNLLDMQLTYRPQSPNDWSFRAAQATTYVTGHKYILLGEVNSPRSGPAYVYAGWGANKIKTFNTVQDTWVDFSFIFSSTDFSNPAKADDLTVCVRTKIPDGGAYIYELNDTVHYRNLMLIDMTAMFGGIDVPTTVAGFLTNFPNAASYMEANRNGKRMSRLYGQTLYGDYAGQTYTVDIPAEIEGSSLTWYVTSGEIYDQDHNITYDDGIQPQVVPTFRGNTRIFTVDDANLDPEYTALSTNYRIDPTIAYENLRNAIVSLGGNV